MTNVLSNADRMEFTGAFQRWFQGNVHAMSLGIMLLDVAHVWDDLIDKEAVPDSAVNGAFCALLLDLPRNPFWQENWAMLLGALEGAYLMWSAANVLEQGQERADLEKAFVLRAGIYQVFTVIARVIGGREWAAQVAPEIWRAYGERLEGFMEKGDA